MNGLPFLAAPNNYIMILNCDWFQPYKHTQFSIGILYLVVGNLPRELRYKRENILIVGIMPGPNEPSKDMNTYLEPLVIEMEKLWNGTSITVNNKTIVIRAAISCLACGIPAARKSRWLCWSLRFSWLQYLLEILSHPAIWGLS